MAEQADVPGRQDAEDDPTDSAYSSGKTSRSEPLPPIAQASFLQQILETAQSECRDKDEQIRELNQQLRKEKENHSREKDAMLRAQNEKDAMLRKEQDLNKVYRKEDSAKRLQIFQLETKVQDLEARLKETNDGLAATQRDMNARINSLSLMCQGKEDPLSQPVQETDQGNAELCVPSPNIDNITKDDHGRKVNKKPSASSLASSSQVQTSGKPGTQPRPPSGHAKSSHPNPPKKQPPKSNYKAPANHPYTNSKRNHKPKD